MSHPDDFPAGSVWLVGAGPGDPDLLTRKAARLIESADVILHDALVGPGVLALAGPAARLVSVGKRAGRHSVAQEDICDALVFAAQSGARVVRLKGGDPSIFGRAREEIEALEAEGITVRICPGITAASAAAASAGTSLTLRGAARQLTYVTAQTRTGEPPDWAELARGGATLAIYMGRSAAPEIARAMIAAGRDPWTPALVAVDVSLPNERLIPAPLCSLATALGSVPWDSAVLVLIGEAVAHGISRQPRRLVAMAE